MCKSDSFFNLRLNRRWTDAKRAAYFVRELYGEYTQEWHPRYDDLGVTISERWTDRARAEEFVGVLRHDQQEEDSRMQTYNVEGEYDDY